MGCPRISAGKNSWLYAKNDVYTNPKDTDRLSYTQQCTIWHTKIRHRAGNGCTVQIQPTCRVKAMDINNYNCPFGVDTRYFKYGTTYEHCECLGLRKEKMKESDKFNCICTRNMDTPILKYKSNQCKKNYRFLKECTIQKVEDHSTSSRTEYKYDIECKFVDCFSDPPKWLLKLAYYDVNCPTTKAPTTTTTSTTTKKLTTTTTTQAPTTTTTPATTEEPTTTISTTTQPPTTTTTSTTTQSPTTTTTPTTVEAPTTTEPPATTEATTTTKSTTTRVKRTTKVLTTEDNETTNERTTADEKETTNETPTTEDIETTSETPTTEKLKSTTVPKTTPTTTTSISSTKVTSRKRVPASTKQNLIMSQKTFPGNIIQSTNAPMLVHEAGMLAKQKGMDVAFDSGRLEYFKQVTEGSTFNFILIAVILQLILMIVAGIAGRKRYTRI